MQDLRVYLKLLTTCLNVNDAQTFYSIGRLLRHPPSARRWGGERVVRRRPTTTPDLWPHRDAGLGCRGPGTAGRGGQPPLYL